MGELTKGKRKRTGEIAARFTQRLKQLREEKGWSQGDCAEKLGTKRTSIANYEQGISFPPLPVLEKMARIFSVSLDSLVWGKDSPEQAIHDRELLELFRRLDKLSSRTRAAVIELFEAIVFKAEHDERVRRSQAA